MGQEDLFDHHCNTNHLRLNYNSSLHKITRYDDVIQWFAWLWNLRHVHDIVCIEFPNSKAHDGDNICYHSIENPTSAQCTRAKAITREKFMANVTYIWKHCNGIICEQVYGNGYLFTLILFLVYYVALCVCLSSRVYGGISRSQDRCPNAGKTGCESNPESLYRLASVHTSWIYDHYMVGLV